MSAPTPDPIDVPVAEFSHMHAAVHATVEARLAIIDQALADADQFPGTFEQRLRAAALAAASMVRFPRPDVPAGWRDLPVPGLRDLAGSLGIWCRSNERRDDLVSSIEARLIQIGRYRETFEQVEAAKASRISR